MLRLVSRRFGQQIRNYQRNFSNQTSPKMTQNKIVWVDLELTGLDLKNDKIMEIACLITDKDLNTIGDGINLIVHQPDNVLQAMGEWCTEHHKNSGLTEACRQSKISVEEAERQVLEYLKKYVKERECPLAGNSIYMDRWFLMKDMPALDKFLHYRLIDVSTVKELCRRWNPEMFWKAPKKKLAHRTLDDIQDSIAEMKYYQQFMFNK